MEHILENYIICLHFNAVLVNQDLKMNVAFIWVLDNFILIQACNGPLCSFLLQSSFIKAWVVGFSKLSISFFLHEIKILEVFMFSPVYVSSLFCLTWAQRNAGECLVERGGEEAKHLHNNTWLSTHLYTVWSENQYFVVSSPWCYLDKMRKVTFIKYMDQRTNRDSPSNIFDAPKVRRHLSASCYIIEAGGAGVERVL